MERERIAVPEPTLIGVSCPLCNGWLRAAVVFTADGAESEVLSVDCTSWDCPVTTDHVRDLLTR